MFFIRKLDCFYQKNEKQFALLDYEQAYEMDAKDETIRNRIANVYYEFAIEKYNEKKYEVSYYFLIVNYLNTVFNEFCLIYL